jgi:hypothetical protein
MFDRRRTCYGDEGRLLSWSPLMLLSPCMSCPSSHKYRRGFSYSSLTTLAIRHRACILSEPPQWHMQVARRAPKYCQQFVPELPQSEPHWPSNARSTVDLGMRQHSLTYISYVYRGRTDNVTFIRHTEFVKISSSHNGPISSRATCPRCIHSPQISVFFSNVLIKYFQRLTCPR